LVVHGSWTKAKEKWLVKLEGKEYIVQDGDCIIFKFNV
jgi:ribosome-binding ATPase YchF (GTP1/OBG family)